MLFDSDNVSSKRFLCHNIVMPGLMTMLSWQTFAQPADLELQVREAQRELNELQADRAFERLMAIEQDAAGDVGYDYWLGVAAVRVGDLEQAITALERVVMIQPLHAGARLELAGIFILQNRMVEASLQLDAVEQLNPPEAARIAIAQYRSIIERGPEPASTVAFSLVAIDLGYDSNYLNYPDSFDLFANTALQGLAILSKDSTAYAQARALHFRSFQGLRPNQSTEWLTVLQARENETSAAQAFNTLSLQSSLTLLAPLSESTEWRFTATLSQLWLDDARYRQGIAIAGGIRHTFNERSNVNLRLRGRDNHFNVANNNNFSWLGEAIWNLQVSPQSRLRVTARHEQENLDTGAVRQGGDSHRSTADLQLQFGAESARHRFSAGINYQRLAYQQTGFAVFNLGRADQRRDSSITTSVEWTFQPASNWRIATRAQHREQSSNINFFKMNQTVLQTSVNYLF